MKSLALACLRAQKSVLTYYRNSFSVPRKPKGSLYVYGAQVWCHALHPASPAPLCPMPSTCPLGGAVPLPSPPPGPTPTPTHPPIVCVLCVMFSAPRCG